MNVEREEKPCKIHSIKKTVTIVIHKDSLNDLKQNGLVQNMLHKLHKWHTFPLGV